MIQTLLILTIFILQNILHSSDFFYILENKGFSQSIVIESSLIYNQEGYDQFGFNQEGYGKENCNYATGYLVDERPDNNTVQFIWQGVSMPTVAIVETYTKDNYMYFRERPALAGNGSAQQLYKICRKEIK